MVRGLLVVITQPRRAASVSECSVFRFASAFLVAFPGLFCLFLILRAFFDGNTADLRYAFGVMVLFGLALMVPLRSARPARRPGLPVLVPAGLAVLLLFPFTVVVLIFGKVDAAGFVFHLIFGMEGTPWGDFIPYMITAFVFWAVIIASVWRLWPLLPRGPILPAAATLFLLAINPLFNDILWNRANAAFGPNRTLLHEFRDPKLVRTTARPDLVVIYLEGFDRGYMDPARFGDIAEPLRELEAEGTSFTHLHQITATGWSLAGTVSTQCGSPLLPLGARPLGDTSTIPRILPNVICLPDLLTARGYALTYMSGAKIVGNTMGFYGFDNYFATHGGAVVLDRDTIPTERTKDFRPEDWGDWGIFDSELYDGARKVFLDRVAKPDPFALFIATMDTHGPAAVLSPACTAEGEPLTGLEDMRPTVSCVARETVRFVRDLMAMKGDRDLRIAIFSDHLNHASNVTDILEAETRYNTAMLLGPGAAPRVIDRHGSMVDLFPTLLHWIGLLDPDHPRAGLGTSLLSDRPTLVERLGLDAVNDTLTVDVQLASFIWRDHAAEE